MSDLISRSEVLELLYKIFNKYRMSTDKNTSIGKSFGTDVFEEIRNMPTAYSVEKVVEELKQGGVSDDVCEWKMDNVGASIGCRIDLHHTGYVNRTYCPYCGKKIKVVE